MGRTALSRPSPHRVTAPLETVLAALLLLLSQPRPVGGVWELEQLWVEDIREYVDKFTGDLDNKGTAIDSKFLKFEQLGWYQKLYDRTSVGMDKVRHPWTRATTCAKAHTCREFTSKTNLRQSFQRK